MPKNNKPTEDDDAKLLQGHPEDGDEINDDEDDPQNLGDADEDDKDAGEGGSQEPSMADVMAAIESIKAENADLRRQLSSAAPPKQTEKPKETSDEIDWEEAIFRDPNAAVKRLKAEITEELTGKYQKTQGQAQFWNDFYSANPDLKEDKDLVEATMAKNMATLATMEVAPAAEKLAELTRERILRYSGKKPPQGKKVLVEGNDPPRQKAPKPEPEKVTTLSDLIRARKLRRAKRGTAA